MDYHTTMIADSRVRYLQEELSRLSGLHIPVISKSGTDFAAIDRELNNLTHWNEVSALYILTDLCQLRTHGPAFHSGLRGPITSQK